MKVQFPAVSVCLHISDVFEGIKIQKHFKKAFDHSGYLAWFCVCEDCTDWFVFDFSDCTSSLLDVDLYLLRMRSRIEMLPVDYFLVPYTTSAVQFYYSCFERMYSLWGFLFGRRNHTLLPCQLRYTRIVGLIPWSFVSVKRILSFQRSVSGLFEGFVTICFCFS